MAARVEYQLHCYPHDGVDGFNGHLGKNKPNRWDSPARLAKKFFVLRAKTPSLRFPVNRLYAPVDCNVKNIRVRGQPGYIEWSPGMLS